MQSRHHASSNKSNRNSLRVMGVIVSAGILLTASACSVTGDTDNVSTPTAVSAEVNDSTSSSATPSSESVPETNSLTEETIASLEKSGMGVSNTIVENSGGSFPQTTFNADNYLTEDPVLDNLPPTVLEGWSDEDVRSALVYGVENAIHFTLDNQFNSFNPDDAVDAHTYDEWLSENGHEIAYDVKEEFYNTEPNDIVGDQWWHEHPGFEGTDVDFIYDGTTPRIRSTDLSLSSVETNFGGVYYYLEGPIQWNAQNGDGEPIVIDSTVDMMVGVVKENNKFKIRGMQSTMVVSDEEIARVTQ